MSNILKIAHLNLSHGFRGGERQTVLLIQNLAQMGVKQILLCRETSPLPQYLQGVPNLIIHALSDRPDARLLGHFIIKNSVDLIQAHETLAAQSAFLHHCLFKTPYVITRRVDDRIRNNIFNRRLYKTASACVGVSSVIADIMTKTFGVDSKTIHSAYSSLQIDPQKATEIKKSWEGKFVIGHIGALVDRHKGQSTLIEAVKELSAKIKNLLVVFLGEGQDKQILEQKSQGLPIEFLGFKKNVADYLSNFDIFAFPSNNEGLGSIILDAMNLKIPVVASNVGGIPDLVQNDATGLLIEKGDHKALAQKIIELYENKSLRERLVTAALNVTEQNSSQAMAEQYLQLYKTICSDQKK